MYLFPPPFFISLLGSRPLFLKYDLKGEWTSGLVRERVNKSIDEFDKALASLYLFAYTSGSVHLLFKCRNFLFRSGQNVSPPQPFSSTVYEKNNKSFLFTWTSFFFVPHLLLMRSPFINNFISSLYIQP